MGTPEYSRIQAVDIRCFQREHSSGGKPADNLSYNGCGVVHVLDDMKHCNQIDRAFRKVRAILNTLAEYPCVAFAAQAIHNLLIQLEAIESGSRNSKSFQGAKESPVSAPYISIGARPDSALGHDVSHFAAVQPLLRLASQRVNLGVVVSVIAGWGDDTQFCDSRPGI